LTKKGNLEKNVDYVLPEDIGMYLPTLLDTGSFMPSDEDHFCSSIHSKGTYETSKGIADKYYVKMNDLSYLNVDTSGALDTYWEDSINLSNNRIAFEASKRDTPWVHTLFTPSEYNSIAEEINQDGSWDEYLPLFDPDNPMFEKANKDTFEPVPGESLPEDKASEKAPKKKFKTVSQSQINQLVDDINLRVQKGDVINQINIDSNGTLIKGSKIHITGKKEPKFMVQVTPYGDFLNEELLGNTPSYLRGTVDTIDGDQAYLLNGHVLFLDDDSNDDMFKTHFTLEEYNDLREQVNLLEGHEDLSWSLPEYNPDNDIFTLAEGRHLPGYVKESNKVVAKLPQWVKDILDNLTEHVDDSTLFTKEINTLAKFMGEKHWGYYLYQKLHRMQDYLKNYPYNKNEVLASSKLIAKEAKKYY